MINNISVEDLQIGDFLPNENKFVEEISFRTNHMIVRLAYQRETYPATSLLLDYDERVDVQRET